MSVEEWCKFWSLLTSELALFHAGLEPTRLLGSFDAFLVLWDDTSVLESSRRGASYMIDHGVKDLTGHESLVDGETSYCFVEDDDIVQAASFDVRPRSEGMLHC